VRGKLVDRLKAALFIAAIFTALLTLTGCGDRYSWNQKLTVTVDTPQGEVSGSAVSSVWWREGGNWNTGWTYDYEGEAVALELPNGRYLFALNMHDEGAIKRNTVWAGTVAAASIAKLRGPTRDKRLFAEVVARSGRAAGIIQIPPYQYPTLVVFKDINDPKTAQKVDPSDLAATFGRGYEFKSATLEITDERRTVGQTQRVLTWLPHVPPGHLDGKVSHGPSPPAPFYSTLAPGSFSTEIKK